MSSPRSHISPAPVRERAMCMCATGAACTSFAPGHALHLIQARLSSATPTEWSDALVDSVDAATGVIGLRLLDGSLVRVWSGAGAASAVSPGLPVALHDRYDVLSVGRILFNCLRD
ncbi:hypothetical protein QL996_09220 [Planococcus sp. APC 4015]|nr:hypothetical protein [Planococcus sp. APC 4015]